jgi:hypothetical protein
MKPQYVWKKKDMVNPDLLLLEKNTVAQLLIALDL